MKLYVLVLTFLVLAQSAAAQENEKFVVGAILPLTGGLADYGLAARNGIELAKDQHPELFSRITFVYEDSQWDAKTAVSAFQRLSYTHRTSLIFNWGNPTTEAIAPIAEKSKVPLIGMTLDSRVPRGKKHLIRSINPASDFSKALATYLKEKGYRRLGVVVAHNTYVQQLLEGLRQHLDPDQHLTTIAEYNLSESDFRIAIQKAKAQPFDAIGVFLISGQVSTFYRQSQDLHLTVPTFGTDFFESKTEIEMAKGGMEGAAYPHIGISSRFETDYMLKYGNKSQIAYAGNAYDMAIMIGTLFNSSPVGLNSGQILQGLRGFESFTGVTGNFQHRETAEGDSYYEFPIRMKRIENGEIFSLPNIEAPISSQH